MADVADVVVGTLTRDDICCCRNSISRLLSTRWWWCGTGCRDILNSRRWCGSCRRDILGSRRWRSTSVARFLIRVMTWWKLSRHKCASGLTCHLLSRRPDITVMTCHSLSSYLMPLRWRGSFSTDLTLFINAMMIWLSLSLSLFLKKLIVLPNLFSLHKWNLRCLLDYLWTSRTIHLHLVWSQCLLSRSRTPSI